MSTQEVATAQDAEILSVRSRIDQLTEAADRTPEIVFGTLVRRALDEVLDGPRTGRWSLGQLSKTEKTYIGTKVEILVRSELALEAGVGIDTVIDGIGVDVKWSQTLQWMIARENVGRLCLGVGLTDSHRKFSVGLFRADEASLRPGVNQDKKRSLTAAAMQSSVAWFVKDAILPGNFIADLSPATREHIFAGKSAQERLRRLAEEVPRKPIPRQAIFTVAMTADALRRTRRDAHKGNPLGNMVLLSTKYGKELLKLVGMEDLPPDHWVAIPVADLPGVE